MLPEGGEEGALYVHPTTVIDEERASNTLAKRDQEYRDRRDHVESWEEGMDGSVVRGQMLLCTTHTRRPKCTFPCYSWIDTS